MNSYLTSVFGPDGLLAESFPGYEPRPGQVALARVVNQGMATGQHVLGEGPCGTGKSVAYGVPAIWHAVNRGQKVVIATANIALQEQLVKKDLPTMADLLPWPFTFVLLKGRSNYLCMGKLRDMVVAGGISDFFDDEQARQAKAIQAWAETTTTGDRAELPFIPLQPLWDKLGSDSDDCLGDACRGPCFAQAARDRADDANIIVTNYHLLFAHVNVRMNTTKDIVLPEFNLLVMDEAHEAADIAREFFGFEVSEYTIYKLSSKAAKLGYSRREALNDEARYFFIALADYAKSANYKYRLKTEDPVPSAGLVIELEALAQVANKQAENADDKETKIKWTIVHRHAKTASARISEAMTLANDNRVYFIAIGGNGKAQLCAKTINVADILERELFARVESATLVSATLATDGAFDFIRAETGVPVGALEVIADSPFDFKWQAKLVVPREMPSVHDEAFVPAAAEMFKEIIGLCQGRTLGLFTSKKRLLEVYELIKDCGYRVMCQHTGTERMELVKQFKIDVGSVLLGTNSFGVGIDVPGEALTALVIDRLPFQSESDPVLDAIKDRDPKSFVNYQVPKTIIKLKQWVGRLIRTKKDFGLVVILDKRILTKGYRDRFRRSLPPFKSCALTLKDVPDFLASRAVGRDSGTGS